MAQQPPDPRTIAEQGTRIYESKYRSQFEKTSRGRFAAIDVKSERAFVADYPEDAIATAKASAPGGTYFLIHIGSPAAFKSSRLIGHATRRGI
jgi:hypothetical protein